ncbi:MAG: FeoA family protein [Weeksellaceae bacterium]|nr:FeoA family protein [Weeksellaceae bacterium]
MLKSNTLFELEIGDSGRISGFNPEEEIPMKLYELGIIPGVFVSLKNRLPFGGPVCIQLKDSPNLIALRSSEAQSILIERFLCAEKK